MKTVYNIVTITEISLYRLLIPLKTQKLITLGDSRFNKLSNSSINKDLKSCESIDYSLQLKSNHKIMY